MATDAMVALFLLVVGANMIGLFVHYLPWIIGAFVLWKMLPTLLSCLPMLLGSVFNQLRLMQRRGQAHRPPPGPWDRQQKNPWD